MRVLALGLAVVALVWGAKAQACAICGCGDPTLTAVGVERPYRNRVRLSLDERSAAQSFGPPDTGDRLWSIRSSLALSWSPHDRFTFAAFLPWLSSWVSSAGAPARSLNGLGDLELSMRVVVFRERRFAPHHLVWAMPGVKAPTGPRLYDTNGHPFSDDVQPGSGSWDPFVGATYAWFSGGPAALFASASYRVTTANSRGYRRGSSLGGSLVGQYQPWEHVAFQLGLEGTWTESDTLPNGAPAPDTGLVVFGITPALLITPGHDLLLRFAVNVPVASAMNGQQTIQPQGIVSLAWDVH